MKKHSPEKQRPVIFDYRAIPHYVDAMLQWRKHTDGDFSIRRATRGLYRCSPSLVTRVAKGQRKLNADRIEPFAKLLKLTPEEKTTLKRWVNSENKIIDKRMESQPPLRTRKRKTEQNHLLSDWVNVYVKDAARLKGFKPDTCIRY